MLAVRAPADHPVDLSLETQSLLRFATAGSVDDGKSTLIGRLLYDAKGLFEDQLAALEASFDLARITDGLRAEREQGITIDVAYRYFATPRRRFIIADCPGHAQYTRNAITGMSHADVAVLLLDARSGLQTQTRRHAFLASMLGLHAVVVCVNKMDLVGYARERFEAIEREVRDAFAPLALPRLDVLPTSALEGAEITRHEPRLDWYEGPTLLGLLESIAIPTPDVSGGRLPVQVVLRPETGEGRSYAGRVASGQLAVGDEVTILPRGTRTRVRAIETFDGSLEAARAGQSVSIRFEEEVDVSRGDLVATTSDAPAPTQRLKATLAWMSERPLRPSGKLLMKVGTKTTRVIVTDLFTRLDLERLEHREGPEAFELNDVGRAALQTLEPVAVDVFAERPSTGRFILIDPMSKETVGAGLVEDA